MGEWQQMNLLDFTTNADRIRAMTDEELARLIQCPYEHTGQELRCKSLAVSEVTEKRCKRCCMEWLRSTGGYKNEK